MKLFFFGGCFDPPHRGHIEMIKICYNNCDKFILMPTISSPLKKQLTVTNPAHIINMLQLIVKEIDKKIQIDKFDINQLGKSYTINTIRYLKDLYPDYSISMILGEDQLMNFKNWEKYKEIKNLVHIIGFSRKQYKYIPEKNMNFTMIDDFIVNISSEQIRKDIVSGEFNSKYITDSVKQYIIKNQLYGYRK